ncbi:MAG: Sir2 silent information regulator family NAD-dependent deacetylase [Selenomonadaceae bacterium]|nr:Sir2 silent information regulator family NAD-dependent deacetylase [Selenomonadaceae bacterium]
MLDKILSLIEKADAVLIGAGAGLSTAAGYTYSGERFHKHFQDFIDKYKFRDMYSAGFYPFKTLEEKWAYWSHHIYWNRYDQAPSKVHGNLLKLVQDKDYFVLTTNVDHLFQNNGFAKERLFYTQGDYGLWQCQEPCHDSTYDNEETVRWMVAEQNDMRIPTELIPYCPVCGEPMTMNLRADNTFVEDAGWHQAATRYHDFLEKYQHSRILCLELGVGTNTPGIIKYPFWRLTAANPRAALVSINKGEAFVPKEIASQSIYLNEDIASVLGSLIKRH